MKLQIQTVNAGHPEGPLCYKLGPLIQFFVCFLTCLSASFPLQPRHEILLLRRQLGILRIGRTSCMIAMAFLAHAPLHAISLVSDKKRYVNFGAYAIIQLHFTPELRRWIRLLGTPPPYCSSGCHGQDCLAYQASLLSESDRHASGSTIAARRPQALPRMAPASTSARIVRLSGGATRVMPTSSAMPYKRRAAPYAPRGNVVPSESP